MTHSATQAEKSCLRCHVSGKVQGVWYRSSTQQQADALGITGYARNLSDGRVEVLACGDAQALEKLQGWLLTGPDHAEVSNVSCAFMQPDSIPARFTTA